MSESQPEIGGTHDDQCEIGDSLFQPMLCRCASRASKPEIGAVIKGPFESTRTFESWCWERPDGHGGLHYGRPEILLRCARIFGGHVEVYRTVEHRVMAVHAATSPGPGSAGDPT